MTTAVTSLLAAVLLAGTSSVGSAAEAGLSTDNARTIRTTGDGTFFIGDCTDKAVALSGDHQTITLLGKCRSIVSHGSGQRIMLDGATALRIVGDGNTVKWKTRPDSVSATGHGNVLSGS